MAELNKADISEARAAIKGTLIETPTLPMQSGRWKAILPDLASGTIKLELF